MPPPSDHMQPPKRRKSRTVKLSMKGNPTSRPFFTRIYGMLVSLAVTLVLLGLVIFIHQTLPHNDSSFHPTTSGLLHIRENYKPEIVAKHLRERAVVPTPGPSSSLPSNISSVPPAITSTPCITSSVNCPNLVIGTVEARTEFCSTSFFSIRGCETPETSAALSSTSEPDTCLRTLIECPKRTARGDNGRCVTSLVSLTGCNASTSTSVPSSTTSTISLTSFFSPNLPTPSLDTCITTWVDCPIFFLRARDGTVGEDACTTFSSTMASCVSRPTTGFSSLVLSSIPEPTGSSTSANSSLSVTRITSAPLSSSSLPSFSTPAPSSALGCASTTVECVTTSFDIIFRWMKRDISTSCNTFCVTPTLSSVFTNVSSTTPPTTSSRTSFNTTTLTPSSPQIPISTSLSELKSPSSPIITAPSSIPAPTPTSSLPSFTASPIPSSSLISSSNSSVTSSIPSVSAPNFTPSSSSSRTSPSLNTFSSFVSSTVNPSLSSPLVSSQVSVSASSSLPASAPSTSPSTPPVVTPSNSTVIASSKTIPTTSISPTTAPSSSLGSTSTPAFSGQSAPSASSAGVAPISSQLEATTISNTPSTADSSQPTLPTLIIPQSSLVSVPGSAQVPPGSSVIFSSFRSATSENSNPGSVAESSTTVGPIASPYLADQPTPALQYAEVSIGTIPIAPTDGTVPSNSPGPGSGGGGGGDGGGGGGGVADQDSPWPYWKITYESFVGNHAPIIVGRAFVILLGAFYNQISTWDPVISMSGEGGVSGSELAGAAHFGTADIGVFTAQIGTAFAGSVVFVDTNYDCGISATVGNQNPCPPRISTTPWVIDVVGTILVLQAAVMAYNMAKWFHKPGGLSADPTAIAGVAAVMGHPQIERQFAGFGAEMSGKELKEAIKDQKFRLGTFTTDDGMTKFGIMPVAAHEKTKPSRLGFLVKVREALSAGKNRTKSLGDWQNKRLCFDMAFGIMLLALLGFSMAAVASIDHPRTVFLAGLDANGIGLKILFALLGILVSFYWGKLFEDTQSFTPYIQLGDGSARPNPTILLSRHTSPICAIIPLLRNGHLAAASVAVTGLMAELLVVALAGLPFRPGQMRSEFLLCGIGAAAILVTMIVQLIYINIWRRSLPHLPRRPDSIAAVMSYVAGTNMGKDFNGLENMSTKERDKAIKDMGKLYAYGWRRDDDGNGRWVVDEVPGLEKTSFSSAETGYKGGGVGFPVRMRDYKLVTV